MDLIDSDRHTHTHSPGTIYVSRLSCKFWRPDLKFIYQSVYFLSCIACAIKCKLKFLSGKALFKIVCQRLQSSTAGNKCVIPSGRVTAQLPPAAVWGCQCAQMPGAAVGDQRSVCCLFVHRVSEKTPMWPKVVIILRYVWNEYMLFIYNIYCLFITSTVEKPWIFGYFQF